MASTPAGPKTRNRRAEIARRLGVRVVERPPVLVAGKLYPDFDILTRSNEEIIRLCDAWAQDEGRVDPPLLAMGRDFRAWATRFVDDDEREIEIAKRIHRFVKDRIRFQVEEVETNRATSITLELGAGDCDDHAVLVVALAVACGLRAKVCAIRNSRGEITHAAPLIHAGGRDWWAETTVDADFGEAPLDAARRLGLAQRADILA